MVLGDLTDQSQLDPDAAEEATMEIESLLLETAWAAPDSSTITEAAKSATSHLRTLLL